MSIFFSPDEPKEFDIHSGRMIRLSSRSSSRSFSRAKSNTIPTKPRKLKVIPEIEELKKIRGAYMKFVEFFDKFSTTNGPEIGGKQLSVSYLLYKQAFDSFLMHGSQYFNTFSSTRRVGRYSPLIEFSQKLLKEWTTIVMIINKLAASVPIPHLQLIQDNFDTLTTNIQGIASSLVNRTYYRDLVYSSSNQLKTEISRVYQLIFNCLSCSDEEEDEDEIEIIRVEMINLSRNINENFIGLIPSNISNTPENIRIRALLKAACGDIISLMEAGFVFRNDIKHLLNRMKTLDVATRAMLDSLGIKYRLDIEPDGEEEDSEPEQDRDIDEFERKIEVHDNKPYYVEIPEARKPRCTSVLTKKPYRGMSGLKKLPENFRRKTISHDIRPTAHSSIEKKTKNNFSKSQPPRPLSQMDEFINTVGESLGLEISPVLPESDKMKVIEKAIKEKMGNSSKNEIEDNKHSPVKDKETTEKGKETLEKEQETTKQSETPKKENKIGDKTKEEQKAGAQNKINEKLKQKKKSGGVGIKTNPKRKRSEIDPLKKK